MADVKDDKPVEAVDVEMTDSATAAPAPATAPAAEASTSSETKAEVKQEAAPVLFNEPLPQLEGKTPEEVQKLLAAAAKQINFYFSDANLPVDRYLFSLTCCNDPLYGWVPIQTLISFARMRDPYQGIGVPFVAYALRQSIASQGPDPLIAVSEDGENVRRCRPMERDLNGAWIRSVYVKGFGEEKEGDTQSKILDYFEQFGEINAVRMRREDKEGAGLGGRNRGKFKGSVFVEFATQEKAEAFVALKAIPKFVPDGEEMVKMSKQQYVDMKTEERKAKGLPVDEPKKGRTDLPAASVAKEGEAKTTEEVKEGEDGGESKPTEDRKNFQARSGGPPGGKFGRGGRAIGDRFNAFRELDKMRRGIPGNVATIPEGVKIVGKAIPVSMDTLKRRRDDTENVDDRNAKRQQTSEPFEIEYLGANIKCDRTTGKVLEPKRIPFQAKSAIKFTGAGEKADWKDFKQQVINKGGIKEPFLAAPPKEQGGRLAKKDNSSFTNEEFDTLSTAKLTYGGVEVKWEHMTAAELQDFWAVRASFQGGVVAKKLKDAEDAADEKLRKDAAAIDAKDVGKHHGGGRGRGNGRGGRGGRGRGGGGRGGRGGDRNREKKDGGAGAATGLPPALGSGGD